MLPSFRRKALAAIDELPEADPFREVIEARLQAAPLEDYDTILTEMQPHLLAAAEADLDDLQPDLNERFVGQLRSAHPVDYPGIIQAGLTAHLDLERALNAIQGLDERRYNEFKTLLLNSPPSLYDRIVARALEMGAPLEVCAPQPRPGVVERGGEGARDLGEQAEEFRDAEQQALLEQATRDFGPLPALLRGHFVARLLNADPADYRDIFAAAWAALANLNRAIGAIAGLEAGHRDDVSAALLAADPEDYDRIVADALAMPSQPPRPDVAGEEFFAVDRAASQPPPERIDVDAGEADEPPPDLSWARAHEKISWLHPVIYDRFALQLDATDPRAYQDVVSAAQEAHINLTQALDTIEGMPESHHEAVTAELLVAQPRDYDRILAEGIARATEDKRQGARSLGAARLIRRRPG